MDAQFQVTGGTLTGTINLPNQPPPSPGFSGALLVMDNDFMLADGYLQIPAVWHTAVYDTDSYFNPAQPDRVTAPADGYYQAICQYGIDASVSGDFSIVITPDPVVLRPDGQYAGIYPETQVGTRGFYHPVIQCSTPVMWREAGDQLMTKFGQKSGAPRLVGRSATFFGITRLG